MNDDEVIILPPPCTYDILVHAHHPQLEISVMMHDNATRYGILQLVFYGIKIDLIIVVDI